MDLKNLMKKEDTPNESGNMYKYDEIGFKLEELEKVNPKLAKAIHHVLLNALSLIVDRNVKKKYGETYAVAGLHGAIFEVIHKSERLKNQVIDVEDDFGFKHSAREILSMSTIGDKLNIDEGPYAHLVDGFNYALLTMTLFHRYLEKLDESSKPE